ncbi:MAG: hypothetical protein ACLP7A_12255 [Desulfobaccales bacterium]
MKKKKRVLVIGLDPNLVDFSHIPDLNAEQVMAALEADQAELNALGYDAQLCLTDLGKTAESVVVQKLLESTFDCILIGAGLRAIPTHFLLFEKLINVVHLNAPKAKICFNTKPSDTAEAVRRWV